jgi:outer membrane protein
MKSASDAFVQFQTQLRSQMSAEIKPGMSPDDQRKLAASYQQQLQAERTKVLQPLVDQTDQVIAKVAKSKGLLLVVNAESRVYGGQDVTADVVKALQ